MSGLSREGEQFETFYRRDMPSLVAFLVKCGASMPEAADAAQEAMAAAFQSWPEVSNPRAWVRKVAFRKFTSQLTRMRQSDAVAVRALQKGTTEFIDTTVESMDRVNRLLDHLPPQQRQVMAWVVDGFSPHEIAHELGLHEATVRSTLRRARQALRARLAEEVPDEAG